MNTNRKLVLAAMSVVIGISLLTVSAFSATAAREYHTNKVRVHSWWNLDTVQVCGTTTSGNYECTPKYRVSGNSKDVTWWFKIHWNNPVTLKLNLPGYGERSCKVPLASNYNEYQLQSMTPWATVSYVGGGVCKVASGYYR